MAEPTFIPVPADKLQDVYRVLTGDYSVIHRSEGVRIQVTEALNVPVELERTPVPEGPAVELERTPVPEEPKAEREAVSQDVDASGAVWDSALHAANKSKTKDGLWRAKRNASKAEEADPVVDAALEAINRPDTAADEEDAWSAAAADGDEEAETVQVREWTDADLGALCSRVAGILKGPDKVREVIGQFVPAGAVVHSRNIPGSDREAFATQLESLARAVDGFSDFSYGA